MAIPARYHDQVDGGRSWSCYVMFVCWCQTNRFLTTYVPIWKYRYIILAWESISFWREEGVRFPTNKRRLRLLKTAKEKGNKKITRTKQHKPTKRIREDDEIFPCDGGVGCGGYGCRLRAAAHGASSWLDRCQHRNGELMRNGNVMRCATQLSSLHAPSKRHQHLTLLSASFIFARKYIRYI